MDDRIAISRIKQGDLHGLETLIQRYQASAVHAAYLVVHDRALAEDVAQTAFVKVDAIKTAKKQKRQLPLEEFDEPTTRLAEWLTHPEMQPERLMEQKEMREHVLKAIQSLPPDQRAVVVMRYFLDMSEADMSSNMDRPLSTVKWWLRDARKRLYDLMSNSR
jgi:RNA polymerase sigma-70 factor (ECF subfamily)